MLSRRDTLHVGAAGLASAALGRTAFGAADTVRTPVDFEVPAGACDCHVHVFGDPARFPFGANRVYTPPPVVIVNPSVYGTDNSCTLDAVRRSARPRAPWW